MECAERLRLEKNYTTASATFDAARVRVQQRIGICPEGEFVVLSDALDWASAELERARAALDAHIWEHCCTVRGTSTVTQE
jgi:hypothetical protein